MQIYKNKLDLVKQSIKDARYIKDSYHKPIAGIDFILTLWLMLFSITVVIQFMIHKYNEYFELSQYSNFTSYYNMCSIIAYLAIPLLTYLYICKYQMSVRERRFLKTWIIFPILHSLLQVMPIIATYFYIDIQGTMSPILINMFISQNVISISLIVQLISMLSIYFYCQYKEIYILVFINAIYMTFHYIYMMIYSSLWEVSELQMRILDMLEYCRMYCIVEIILTTALIFILRRREKNDKINGRIKSI